MEYTQESLRELAERIYDLDAEVYTRLGSSLGRVFNRDRERCVTEIVQLMMQRDSGHQLRSELALISNMARTIPDKESRSMIMREYTGILQIDNMMNLELLLWAAGYSGDESFRKMAVSHADKTMEYHYRPDFSSWHVVSYDTVSGKPHIRQTHQGFSDDSAWSRGQAWGLYGYTCMFRLTGEERYLQQARRSAVFLLNHPNMPADGVPYWDFDSSEIPDTPRDASAAAIMASALIELSGFAEGAEADEYMAFAEKQIRSLASPEYTAPEGTNGDFILMHSTGAYPFSSEVDVPLTYADYYYLEALTRLKRRLQS